MTARISNPPAAISSLYLIFAIFSEKKITKVTSMIVAAIIPMPDAIEIDAVASVKSGKYAMMSSNTVARDAMKPMTTNFVNLAVDIICLRKSFFSALDFGL